MSLDIVTCPPDRFRDLLEVDTVAFAESMPPEQVERFEKFADKDRFFTAIDDGTLVASCGIFSFRMTVPGAEVPVGGVTFVAVLPSHRRQGLATAMMRRMFEDCRSRGEPIAILWASEAAIYQRFGYGLATYAVNLEAETRGAVWVRQWPQNGRVRLVKLDEALPLVAPIHDAVARGRAGFLGRSPDWWGWTSLFDEKAGKGAEEKRVAVYYGDSGPEAYAIYRVKAEWSARGAGSVLTVMEALGSTPAGTRAIWRWLFDVDLVRTLRAWHLPPDHPVLFLAAEARRLGATVGDGIWLRILDVKAALEARRYEADGALTFELDDAFCGENAGCWTMRVEGGRASVERGGGEPDLTLDANDLGSIYLGGFAPSALASAGRIVEAREGGLAIADRLFRTALAPWCPMEF